jgi:hypothetical protein
MNADILERNKTDLNSVIRGFRCDNITPEEIFSVKLPHETDIMIAMPCKKRSWVNQGFVDVSFVLGPNTKAIISFKEADKQLIKMNNPGIRLDPAPITNDISTNIEEEQNILKSLASKLLFRIEELESAGRFQESIKEIHKLFEKLLSMASIDVANQILLQASKKRFSLTILVAFLTSTSAFKIELPNRSFVFDLAEKIAIKELGQDNLNRSIFHTLK